MSAATNRVDHYHRLKAIGEAQTSVVWVSRRELSGAILLVPKKTE